MIAPPVSSGDAFFFYGPFMRGHKEAAPFFDFDAHGEFVDSAFVGKKLVWSCDVVGLSSTTGRVRGIVYRLLDADNAADLDRYALDQNAMGAQFRREKVELCNGLGEAKGVEAWAYLFEEGTPVNEGPAGVWNQWMFSAHEQGAGLFGEHFFDFRREHNTGWFCFDAVEGRRFVKELGRRGYYVLKVEAYRVDGTDSWREPEFGTIHWAEKGVTSADIAKVNAYFLSLFDQAEEIGGSYRFEIFPDVPEQAEAAS